MTRKGYRLLTLIVVLTLFFNGMAFAKPLKDLQAENLAISLVIDTSGSMTRTDPQKLRGQVADIFVDLLNPDDYLGIVTFNSDVDLVIPMAQLYSDKVKDSFKEELEPNLEAKGNTDYLAALDQAKKQLDTLNEPELNKMIVFLTDGEPDPDEIGKDEEKMKVYMDELWDLVADISKSDYPVFSIGFSDEIDVEVLERIAAETNGELQIFPDDKALNEGLIKTLKSRETIVEQLLTSKDKNKIDSLPGLSTDFWIREDGYRLGEELVVSSYLNHAGRRVEAGGNLKVESYEIIIESEVGTESIPLYDDGNPDHGDTREGDGIWSNRLVFDQKGSFQAKILVKGKFNSEAFELEEEIGQYQVGDLGLIRADSFGGILQARPGSTIRLPLSLTNDSEFKERISVKIDDELGSLNKQQIDLDAKWSGDVGLFLNLDPSLQRGDYKLRIELESADGTSEIENWLLEYDLEIISVFQHAKNKLAENNLLIMLLALIFLGLPLLIYLLGMLLYLLLLRSRLRVKGRLSYWKTEDPDSRENFDLSRGKSKTIKVTMGSLSRGNFTIPSRTYNYDLIISTQPLSEKAKFLQGWMTIFSRKPLVALNLETSQPGIIIHRGDIVTKMELYNGAEFSSGDYNFIYEIAKSRDLADSGKDVLEGKL